MRYSTLSRRRAARALRARTRPLAAVLVGGLLAGALSSCSTSPPVATVNGQDITLAQLDQQLQDWASDAAYVRSTDSSLNEIYQEEQQQGMPPLSIAGQGTGPGVYGTYWAAGQLSLMVSALAVHEYVAAHHEAPSALQVTAAWDGEYAKDPGQWAELAPAVREASATQDAERALASGKLSGLSAAQAFYKSHRSYFWSQVCLTVADAPTARQASTEAKASLAGGALECVTPEKLLEQPPAFRAQVRALAAGRTTVIAAGRSFEVVRLRYRAGLSYTSQVAADILVSGVQGGSQSEPNGNTKVDAILKSAAVAVNPAYGSWAPCEQAPNSPVVLPAFYTSPCPSTGGSSTGGS